MWNFQKNNLLCSYLDAYEDQKRHIERVLSAKDTTKSTTKPYYPKFLKCKISKNHMEEEKNDKINEENDMLFIKIYNAVKKHSKYSKIYKPKKCPAFDKEKILLKRIKYEINNYQENIRFYNRIENVHSFYPNKTLIERNKDLDEASKILQKSIFDTSPNLMFSSPERIKNEIEKFRNKKNKSTFPKTSKSKSKSFLYKNNVKNSDEKEIINNSKAMTNKDEKKEDKNYKKINNNIKNKNINSKSKEMSRNLSESQISKKSKNDKNKRSQSTLRRNESEINILG